MKTLYIFIGGGSLWEDIYIYIVFLVFIRIDIHQYTQYHLSFSRIFWVAWTSEYNLNEILLGKNWEYCCCNQPPCKDIDLCT